MAKQKTKICRYCKSEIDAKASICPNCRKKQASTGKTLLVMIIFFVFVFFLLCFMMAKDGTSMKETVEGSVDENTITLEEYNQIEDGMTLDQVVEIVGCEGAIDSSSEAGGMKIDAYIWYGSNPASDAVVTFTDDKVSAKSQVNLK